MKTTVTTAPPLSFDEDFRARLQELYLWRRDVRRFRTDPIDPAVIDTLIQLAMLAPSVGNSQPWRFVKVDDTDRRSAIRRNFEACNRDALLAYSGERAQLYARLKLSGLENAPVQLAIFSDSTTERGRGLGRRTMPQMLDYSVVCAVHALWLAARAHGIGMGWVSILEPQTIRRIIDVPENWTLIAYLCLGYAEEEHLDPELERHGWQERVNGAGLILQR